MFINKMYFIRSLLTAFLVSGLLILPANANDASRAMKLIQNMSDAMHQKNYSGDFVYVNGDQLESMTISHMRLDNGVKQRLLSLNGEAREVIRDDENLTCVWPDSKKVVQDNRNDNTFSPLWIPEDVERLSKFYDFRIIGEDRVADRQCIVLTVIPKDKMRYGMKIWIDDKEHYLLKSLLSTADGQILEQMMFTRISSKPVGEELNLAIPAKIPQSFELVASHTVAKNEQSLPDNRWKFNQLPQGFWMDTAYKKPSEVDGEFLHHLVFTDGLASVSLFIEKQTKQSLLGKSSMGAINAYGILINDYAVTAVGEVPEQTVQQLVTAVYYE